MDRIAVFARWPEEGRVKTRLSPALPASMARDLSVALLRDALDVAAACSAGERILYWADAPSARQAEFAPPAGFEVRDQKGGDLGARLEDAFAAMLRERGDRAVVIGTDAPELDAETIHRALSMLDRHDIALGPASDGGYYLAALARPAPELFREIDWGTERVRAQTLERARGARLRVALLDMLEDLDTPADLTRWLTRAALNAQRGGTHTRAALREMGLLPA
jgi:rSAM/selenodomain-associated transferase 1